MAFNPAQGTNNYAKGQSPVAPNISAPAAVAPPVVSTSTPNNASNPAYTPTRPAGAGGFIGIRRANSPALSNSFASLVGGAGGLGRKPSTAKRSLIGGE